MYLLDIHTKLINETVLSIIYIKFLIKFPGQQVAIFSIVKALLVTMRKTDYEVD